MQHHPRNHTYDQQQQHEGHWYAEQASVGKVAKEVETFNSAGTPLLPSFRDEASEAAIKQQTAKRDDEWLHIQASNQQSMAQVSTIAMTMIANTPNGAPNPHSVNIIDNNTPSSAIIDPTDNSMLPVMITSPRPILKIPNAPICRARF